MSRPPEEQPPATRPAPAAAPGQPPSVAPIRAELVRLGLLAPAAPLELHPVSGNPLRSDHLTRRHHRAVSAGKTLANIEHAPDLADHWRRTTAFAAACPDLTCLPLFHLALPGGHVLAHAHFAGHSLETLWRQNQLNPDDLTRHLARLVAALERTLQPSAHADAAREAEAFFARFAALPSLTDHDRQFFHRTVFPFILDGIAAAPAHHTRWTNGDLIPRNILLSPAGELRLIDHEFASRTHFFAEDAWRWRTFNSLPEKFRALPLAQPALPDAPWLEAWSLLRQIFLADRIHAAGPKSTLSRTALERLLALIPAPRFAAPPRSPLLQPLATLRALWRQLVPPPKLRRRGFIETPRTWRCTGTQLTVIGWCHGEEPDRPVVALRARIKNRTYPALHGLDRPDVSLNTPEFPSASASGFILKAELLPKDKLVELQTTSDHVHWETLCKHRLHESSAESVHGTYAHWIKTHDTPTPAQLAALADAVSKLPRQPLVSVLLPTYNTPDSYLRRAIESVRAQVYPHWELCVADDASTAPHVRATLAHYAALDPRIRVHLRPENGHIAAASNSALSLATGDYIALLDHDDELRPHTLAEIVRALHRHPDAEFLYTDEDMIDADGNRYDPYFKPDWMPDLLTGHNYMCHFAVYRAATVRALGGWRPGFDGAQDWDLQLRVTERLSPAKIVHIPKILYHWRAVAGSTALATAEKDYVVEAARRALTEHLARTGQHAELLHQPGNHWRVRHALPEPAPLVSLIIPTRNGHQLLRTCLESILAKTTYPALEILVVDNASDDQATIRYLQTIAGARPLRAAPGRTCAIRVLPYPHPFNYSAINNHAVRHARGEFVALLNDDIEVLTPGWLDEMVSQAARPGIGCVGAMLYYPDDKLQHAGVILGIGGVAGHAFKGFRRGTGGSKNRARLVANYSAVTGACLVVRKSTYEQVGGLDETALGVSLNDVDFCLKVRAAGHRNLWTPFAELRHHESATRGYEDTPEKMARFEKERDVMKARWGELLRADPAYNPNLTLATEDFALAYPPRGDASL